MRFVIQRVTDASVTIDGEISGKIGKGYLVLIGVADTDTKEIADTMIRKMIGLRIFEDEQGKTNLSLADVDGGLLLVSLYSGVAKFPSLTGVIRFLINMDFKRFRDTNISFRPLQGLFVF